MAIERRSVEVWADWSGLGGPRLAGMLNATPARGKEIFSFEYDRSWLASPHGVAIDPSLRLHPGPQQVAIGRANFGVFLDASPDRWGRVLMQRREAQLAREQLRQFRCSSRSTWPRNLRFPPIRCSERAGQLGRCGAVCGVAILGCTIWPRRFTLGVGSGNAQTESSVYAQPTAIVRWGT